MLARKSIIKYINANISSLFLFSFHQVITHSAAYIFSMHLNAIESYVISWRKSKKLIEFG